MKLSVKSSNTFHNKLYNYYLNIFLINRYLKSKYQYQPSILYYMILRKKSYLFRLTGWYSRLTNRNSLLNQVLLMNCNMSQNYFKLYVPMQMPILYFSNS